MPKITLTHRGAVMDYDIRRGLGFQALCAKYKTAIDFDCREADCGICIITVTEGMDNLSPKTSEEAEFLVAMQAAPAERLACQTRILGSASIVVDY